MARLKSPEALEAYEKVMELGLVVTGEKQFLKVVDNLIRVVQNDTELALMRGRHGHLGEKHMLLSDLLCALSLCHRPIQREAAYSIIKSSLDRYLGIELPGLPTKRPRRKLLPHV